MVSCARWSKALQAERLWFRIVDIATRNVTGQFPSSAPRASAVSATDRCSDRVAMGRLWKSDMARKRVGEFPG
ncbi:hypothetical protein V1264_022314 [Littorina saxatilis]|uniref:Uncharacterized protein n=1 Tax=Littorina saxatilis TaxID=31220 RepID=A0AAN9AKC6_9CAEN